MDSDRIGTHQTHTINLIDEWYICIGQKSFQLITLNQDNINPFDMPVCVDGKHQNSNITLVLPTLTDSSPIHCHWTPLKKKWTNNTRKNIKKIVDERASERERKRMHLSSNKFANFPGQQFANALSG